MYFMPYEPELGQHPSLEQMRDFVVERKQRPKIEDAWRQRKVGKLLLLAKYLCRDALGLLLNAQLFVVYGYNEG